MKQPSTVAIIGLGLMGGSLARDLSNSGHRILGYDTRPDVAAAAIDCGVVERLLNSQLEDLETADLVVLAVPVDQAMTELGRVAGLIAPSAAVTDVGSTKTGIVRAAEGLGLGECFIGSHPLAGDHRSGWTAARAALYRNATVFLCPTSSTSAHARSAVRRMWDCVGAHCVEIAPDDHDRRMAWISHLPQVASTAVAGVLAESGFPPAQLGPGGRDVTRLAGSSPEMWRAIAAANAEALAEAVGTLRSRLDRFERALRTGDQTALEQFFRDAHEWSVGPT